MGTGTSQRGCCCIMGCIMAWSGAILDLKAAKHFVPKTNAIRKRRTTAVVFVAPGLDATLKPVEGSMGSGVSALSQGCCDASSTSRWSFSNNGVAEKVMRRSGRF